MTSLEQAARALLESLEEWPHYSLDVKNAEKRLRAALDAEAGRVSVPREPTPAMLKAGYESACARLLGDYDNMDCNTDEERSAKAMRLDWLAMVAAAQEGS